MPEQSYETSVDLSVLGEVDAVINYDYRPPDKVIINDVILRGVALSPYRLSELIGLLNNDRRLIDEIIDNEMNNGSES